MKTNSLKLSLLFASTLMYTAFTHAADTVVENLNLPTVGIWSIEMNVDAGFLIVRGDSNVSEISVKAEIVDSPKDYVLTLKKSGAKAVLTTEIHNQQLVWFGNDYPRIDLTVTVPKSLPIKIKDGSGEIDIKDLSTSLTIEDGSGSILVRDLAGKLDIDDGSGSIEIAHVSGSVAIDDGSGSIDLSNVGGDVTIKDGSGSIDVRDIQGALTINDGSGGVSIQKVAGEVNIRDGSGSMKVADIDGHVTIDDGSGGIDVTNVSDGLTINESGSGGLRMKNISGKIQTD